MITNYLQYITRRGSPDPQTADVVDLKHVVNTTHTALHCTVCLCQDDVFYFFFHEKIAMLFFLS